MEKNITKRVKYYTNFMSLYEFLADARYSSPDQDVDFKGEIEIEPEMLNSLVQQFNRLYISRRKGYLVQSYSQIHELGKAFTYKEQTLSDIVLQNHLLGKQTIACYPCNSYTTKWFLFDVDVALNDKNAITLAKRCTKRLINTLRKYIPEEYIHCYRSGSKGYHVVIYLSEPALRQRIEDFQQRIIAMAGLQGLKNASVEIIPQITDETKQGKTAKLPLGRNHINLEYGSNFCCLVNLDTLEYKPSQYRNFLEIEPLNRDFFNNDVVAVIEEVAPVVTKMRIPKRRIVTKVETAPRVIQEKDIFAFCNSYEITAHGQRHDMTFDLALRLKNDYKLSQKETEAALIDWLDNQEGGYGSSKAEAIRDTKFQAQYVYSRGYERRGKLIQSIVVTKDEAAFFADIVNDKNKIGIMERNAITLLVAFIRHAKLFGDNQFFMSYDQIERISAVRRMAINPCITRLEHLGKIEIIERIDFKKGITKANRYKIALDVTHKEAMEGYIIHYDSEINVLDILSHFYSVNQLKSMLTKSLYNNILES
ncbi:TOTE conflict system archaeo-eukaryotic primase domain-containing protein [Cohnella panacarvi]|uniref:TOTE conflict system archaeo-eukaryotic primase domain-containing protein n=1 Tax=Cohnella panacarvi TaxID=400776 RepID=UPI0004ADC647|nr:hypothetical protein [Cohnella panacarvi]